MRQAAISDGPRWHGSRPRPAPPTGTGRRPADSRAAPPGTTCPVRPPRCSEPCWKTNTSKHPRLGNCNTEPDGMQRLRQQLCRRTPPGTITVPCRQVNCNTSLWDADGTTGSRGGAGAWEGPYRARRNLVVPPLPDSHPIRRSSSNRDEVPMAYHLRKSAPNWPENRRPARNAKKPKLCMPEIGRNALRFPSAPFSYTVSAGCYNYRIFSGPPSRKIGRAQLRIPRRSA